MSYRLEDVGEPQSTESELTGLEAEPQWIPMRFFDTKQTTKIKKKQNTRNPEIYG